MDRKTLIYPIPLNVPKLPAAVKMEGFLSAEECSDLIAAAEAIGIKSIEKDRFGGESTTGACRIHPEHNENIYKKFAKLATDLNSRYWRLNLAGIYEPMRFLRYQKGDWIRPHIDADYRVPDTSKLTCTFQLVPKSSYTGGVFTIAETEHFELDLGDAVLFPSHMLHTVSKVESGVRTVVSAWMHGSAFR